MVFKRLNIEVVTSRRGRDINTESEDVATSFSGRYISFKTIKVATSFSSRDISCKELRSRRHLAVTTSYPRDAKDKSRPNKSFCDVAETTKVATKNQGRDINNQMGQLI